MIRRAAHWSSVSILAEKTSSNKMSLCSDVYNASSAEHPSSICAFSLFHCAWNETHKTWLHKFLNDFHTPSEKKRKYFWCSVREVAFQAGGIGICGLKPGVQIPENSRNSWFQLHPGTRTNREKMVVHDHLWTSLPPWTQACEARKPTILRKRFHREYGKMLWHNAKAPLNWFPA